MGRWIGLIMFNNGRKRTRSDRRNDGEEMTDEQNPRKGKMVGCYCTYIKAGYVQGLPC